MIPAIHLISPKAAENSPSLCFMSAGSQNRKKAFYGRKTQAKGNRLKVLVACEYSGRVRDAFIALGHDAVSCDLLPTERPGPHVQGDVIPLLRDPWDLIVAHPPCTYLTCAAEWAYGDGPYHQEVKSGTLVGASRRAARNEALAFVALIWNANSPRVAIENPVGVLSRTYGAPQVVQPYHFGDDASKATCFWTRGLPPLAVPPASAWFPPRMVNGRPRWGNQTDSGQNRVSPGPDRWKERSLTYQGIANAIAEQWSRGAGVE